MSNTKLAKTIARELDLNLREAFTIRLVADTVIVSRTPTSWHASINFDDGQVDITVASANGVIRSEVKLSNAPVEALIAIIPTLI